MHRNSRHRRQRGITLIEVLVAITVSIIIFTMAVEVLQTTTTSLGWIEQASVANDEAKILNEWLAISLMSVGGGLIRPWTSLWVENDFDGTGSDRITFADLVDNALQCNIVSIAGSTVVGDSTYGCCLSSAYEDRQVIIVSGPGDNGQHWESRFFTDLNPTLCSGTLSAGAGTVLNVSPASTAVWVGGTIAVVNVRTIWVDSTNRQLMVSEDFDLDGDVDVRVVADRVVDLQCALGYDVAPWNWNLADTGGTNDEWLHNAEGDTFGLSDGQGLGFAERDELRMVRFGFMVGAPVTNRSTPAAISMLNGPARTVNGWVLRSVVSVTGLRNYDIMR